MTRGQTFNMEEEFAGLDCNSSRLEERFIKTMETLSQQPNKSIWSCSENRAEAKAIYRLLGNENLDREEILKAHREATVGRMIQQGGTVLAIQDARQTHEHMVLKRITTNHTNLYSDICGKPLCSFLYHGI